MSFVKRLIDENPDILGDQQPYWESEEYWEYVLESEKRHAEQVEKEQEKSEDNSDSGEAD